MPYSQFTFRQVKKQFNLIENNHALFSTVKSIPISTWLKETLEKSKLIPLRSEKARSEGIVAPILLEIKVLNEHHINLFSGEPLDVDTTMGLNGECDFIFSTSPTSTTIDTPVFCLIEAKQHIIENSLGQCVAQMMGARLYNQTEGSDISVIYGCVTTGEIWQFIKLEGDKIAIDKDRYFIDEPEKIIAILQNIVNQYIKVSIP